uniref:Uncharacterized protein LOC114343343 n=1 Tax=Diabrotica virgifera virgifera TaxID=50390 RepID=A0A6P7GVB5_DIAVI
MARVTFNTQDIDRFNDRIQNVLQNPPCRGIYRNYLFQYKRMYLDAFKLWLEANDTKEYNEDKFLDLIEDVDEFNMNPLYSLQEHDHKIDYIKQECCRILEKTRASFIGYLRRHHM